MRGSWVCSRRSTPKGSSARFRCGTQVTTAPWSSRRPRVAGSSAISSHSRRCCAARLAGDAAAAVPIAGRVEIVRPPAAGALVDIVHWRYLDPDAAGDPEASAYLVVVRRRPSLPSAAGRPVGRARERRRASGARSRMRVARRLDRAAAVGRHALAASRTASESGTAGRRAACPSWLRLRSRRSRCQSSK